MTMRPMEGLFARMLADIAKKDDIATVKVKVEKNTERIEKNEEVTRDLRHEFDSLKNEARSGADSSSSAAAAMHSVAAHIPMPMSTGIK